MERKSAPSAVSPQAKDAPVIKKIDDQSLEEGDQNMQKRLVIGVYALLVLLGVGTGYLLSRTFGGGALMPGSKSTVIKTETVVGSTDTQTFKDSAEGIIEKGGIDGEGSHKLIRDGGPSQTAFLISSVIDLDEYVGKKVKVWGQTFAAKKASWLMDVGKIELQ